MVVGLRAIEVTALGKIMEADFVAINFVGG
jgi:hypothetical protein